VLLIVAAAGIWTWSRPRATFEGTAEARQAYERGQEWIRSGAYSSGRRALLDATHKSEGFVPA
jgi:hypothetical protein